MEAGEGRRRLPVTAVISLHLIGRCFNLTRLSANIKLLFFLGGGAHDVFDDSESKDFAYCASGVCKVWKINVASQRFMVTSTKPASIFQLEKERFRETTCS